MFRVTVIVPTLNEEKNIASCLKSISSQGNVEVIVSDGNSRDKTLEIAKNYTDNIIISNKRSPAIQRNLGAKNASGDILIFIDADTVMSKNYIKKAVEKFSDKDLVGFSGSFVFSGDSKCLRAAERILNSYFKIRDRMGIGLLPGFNICVRKKAFKELKGFRDIPLEDGDFAVRLRKLGKIRYFTDIRVTTSSRRLEKMGLLGTLKYYLQMDIASRSSRLGKFLTYGDYFPCREGKKLEELKRRKKAEISKELKKYIRERSNQLFLTKAEKLKNITKTQLMNNISDISGLITDFKLRTKVTKEDIDRAIKLIKDKINMRKGDRI